jgi:hypothetical protein
VQERKKQSSVDNTLAKNGFVVSESLFRLDQFFGQMLEITCTDVFAFPPFEQIPHPFLGTLVPVRKQANTPNAGAWLCQKKQKIFHRRVPMDRGFIPDHHQFAQQFSQQYLQKVYSIGAAIGCFLTYSNTC